MTSSTVSSGMTTKGLNEIFDVYKNMHLKKYEMLPVKQNGKFEGVLDLENLNEFFMIRQAMQYEKKLNHIS
jgi:hypothetical protein